MADVFTEKKRSEIMSKIRSKNTKLETSFCKLISKTLYQKGLRYRKHYKKLVGNPDIVFVNRKLAVFIDGDFWHGYNFKKIKNRLPKKYWRQKIQNNIKRDKKINRELKNKGWTVVRIWEHEIKKFPAKALNKVIHALKD
jgi:DNA mismatch endonuclease (patch repair protein)